MCVCVCVSSADVCVLRSLLQMAERWLKSYKSCWTLEDMRAGRHSWELGADSSSPELKSKPSWFISVFSSSGEPVRPRTPRRRGLEVLVPGGGVLGGSLSCSPSPRASLLPVVEMLR